MIKSLHITFDFLDGNGTSQHAAYSTLSFPGVILAPDESTTELIPSKPAVRKDDVSSPTLLQRIIGVKFSIALIRAIS